MTIGPFIGKWEFLSNFHPSPVEFGGIVFSTVEHAYQAAKSHSHEQRKHIASLRTPGQAKRAGGRMVIDREAWEARKFDIMLSLVRAKFQHPELRQKLIETGEEEIVEINHWGDKEWGRCSKTGEGKNMLGKILMQVRAEYCTS